MEELLSLMAQHSEDIFSIRDHKGIVMYASPSFQKMLGYRPEEVIGEKMDHLIHPEDLPHLHDALGNHANEHFTVQYRIRTKSGYYKWVEASLKGIVNKNDELTQLLDISRDITKRKKNEDYVKKNSEWYQRLVEQSPYAIMLGRNRKIHYINETGVKLLGAASKQEVLNRDVLDFIDDGYHQQALEYIRRARAGEPTGVIEQRWLKVDGTPMDIQVKAFLSELEDEPSLQAVIIDRSEHKQFEKLSVISDKLSIAGELAAGIAHEIRNPLTSLKGFIQLIEHSEVKNKEYFEIMYSELARLETIINELLQLSRPNPIKFELIALKQLIRSVVTLCTAQTNLYDVKIDTSSLDAEEEVYTKGDSNQLKQVFINFIKNAIEAMPDGGLLKIEAKSKDGLVMIIISDTGTGIDEAALTKIGTPFFTTKESGTGLGLSVSFSIIEKHGGSVNISSKVNDGSTFTISLPIAEHQRQPFVADNSS